MNNSRHSDINELRSRINIVQVIGHYLSLEKKGNNYWAVCPFHGDTNPSLSVSETKQVFNCFSCNTKGDVFSFVQMYKHISYNQAILETCKIAGIDTKEFKDNHNSFYNEKNERFYSINAEALKLFKLNLKHESANQANTYLNNRQLDKQLINHFEIGYALNQPDALCRKLTNAQTLDLTISISDLKNLGLAEKNKDQVDFFIDRIIFPIHDENNNVVAFSGRKINDANDLVSKYKNTSTTEIFSKERILYNLNRVKSLSTLSTIYLCEGYMDVIALYRINALNAIAMMGVNLSTYHIESLKKIKELKEVVIVLDNDNAGKNATIVCARKLLNANFSVSVINFSQFNCKDLDELVLQKSISDIFELSNYQIDYFDFFLNHSLQNLHADSKPADLVNVVESNLKEIKQYANKLLWTKYLERLSNKVNINLNDLQSRFNTMKVNLNNYENEDSNPRVGDTTKYSFEPYKKPVQTFEKSISDAGLADLKKEEDRIYFLKLSLLKQFYFYKKAVVDFGKILPGGALKDDFFMKLYIKMSLYYNQNNELNQTELIQMINKVVSVKTSSEQQNKLNDKIANDLINYILHTPRISNYSRNVIVTQTYELMQSSNKYEFIKKQLNINNNQNLHESFKNNLNNYSKNFETINDYFHQIFNSTKKDNS